MAYTQSKTSQALQKKRLVVAEEEVDGWEGMKEPSITPEANKL